MKALAEQIGDIDGVNIYGRVVGVRGLMVEIAGPIHAMSVGARIVIETGGNRFIPAEVIGFSGSNAVVMPFGGLDGVRAGNVIAFGVEGRRGKEGIVVVAEHKADDLAGLHDAVIDRVCDAVGIPPLEVVFVTPGTLPKTSSGKLQRSACRTQYHGDALTRA